MDILRGMLKRVIENEHFQNVEKLQQVYDFWCAVEAVITEFCERLTITSCVAFVTNWT